MLPQEACGGQSQESLSHIDLNINFAVYDSATRVLAHVTGHPVRRRKQARVMGKYMMRKVEDMLKKKGFKSEMGNLILKKTIE